jgi:predicted transcriptional regulator
MNSTENGRAGVNVSQACPERAVAFIRAMYPSKTADHVAYDTGIAADTVRKWIEGAAKPSWVGLSRLIFAYGPAFLAAVYPSAPKWLDEAHRREMQASLRAEQQRISDQLDALERSL